MDNSVRFPHMGTVQEAAEASGLAKSHIRRLLADGTVSFMPSCFCSS